eukprot:scaffold104426_cov58-Phaeocystis_antarctica.AAC.2
MGSGCLRAVRAPPPRAPPAAPRSANCDQPARSHQTGREKRSPCPPCTQPVRAAAPPSSWPSRTTTRLTSSSAPSSRPPARLRRSASAVVRGALPPLPHTRPPPPCDGRARARASARPRDRRRTADPRRASSPPSAAWLKTRRYDALGVATFGPVDLNPASPTYGYITTTPKPGWKHTDVLGPLRAVDPSAPILFDTDVNAPQRAP